MATNYGKKCENENYGGMCKIYVDLYRDLLWAVFIKEVPIPKLVSELAKFLKNAHTRKPFHHQFRRLLNDVYASTGTIKNTDCDISVIYSLFRNIPTTLVPPTRGWDNVPHTGDVLITDDLERIHHGRNELIGHAREASITDADFTAQLSDITTIVKRLGGHLGSSYLSHLLQIESDCQSSKGHLNHYDDYINDLKRQRDAEADLKAKFDEHDTRLGGHDTTFDEHGTRLKGHDATFDEHGTRLKGHDATFDEHGTRLKGHDATFDEHDTRLKGHDATFDEHGTRLKGHDATFDEHDTRLKGHDATFDEHGTSLKRHDATFDEHGTSLKGHDATFGEHGTSLKGHDATFGEHGTRLKRHDATFDEHGTRLKRHDATFDEHGTSLKRHDATFDEHGTSLKGHDATFGEHGTRLKRHDATFDEHGTRLKGHDATFDEHGTRLKRHDATFDEHGTRLKGHDATFGEHGTRLKRHDATFDEHGTRLKGHDATFDEHGTRLKGHDATFDEHGTRLKRHDATFDEHGTSLKGHDATFGEHGSRLKRHDATFDEHGTRLKGHDATFDEHDTRLKGHDATFDEHGTRLKGHDATLDEHGTKLNEHVTKFGNLETKLEEQEQICTIVQHTLEEQRHERDEDRRRLTAVKRRHEKEEEEERQKKQKKLKELSAGQDTLKNYLLELYRYKILLKEPNMWFSMKDVLQMVVPLDIRKDLERWMALSRADRKEERNSNTGNRFSKAGEGTKLISKREMFFKGLERQFEIYLLGEAGVGKSTFCHQLIDDWCSVQDTESNDDYLRELKSFPFLFFIQARHAKESQSVYKMIQSQICPLKFRSNLEEVFTSHPENCLVLIDGLDEWQSGTSGYQELPNVTDIKGSTILITSRQWRIEALDCDLASSCRVLEIQGLDSYGIANLADKAFEAFTREYHQCSDCTSLVKPFLAQMYALKLDNLAKIPLILLILIRSWLDGNRKLENARGFIYSGLIESLLIHSKKYKKVELSKTWGDRTKPTTLPTCFSDRGNCLDYNVLLNELARLAFVHLISTEKENTLVIRKYDLAKQPKVEEHLHIFLKLGLLIESKDFCETNENHRAFVFPHKSIQEFFCAVHLSRKESETDFAKFCERVTCPAEAFDFENVVSFLSGMNLTRCKTLFDYICNIVFTRHFANYELYPPGWYVLNDVVEMLNLAWSMHDEKVKIPKLAELCTAEARHSVPEESHTGELQFVIHDMVVFNDTPEEKVQQFCKLGLNIKSLRYHYTETPFSVVESIKTMLYIQRLGIGCTAEDTEKYIVYICTYLSNLHQLKSFSFIVGGASTVILPIHVSTELVSKLGTLPKLVSVYLMRLDLSDINTCQFTKQLTSLGLHFTQSLSPGFVSGMCTQLQTLYLRYVYPSPAAVHQICQYLMTSSSLQCLTLSLPYMKPYTVCDDVLDLTSHISLQRLRLDYIDMKSGVRIHPGNHWRWILISNVSMSGSMWQEFIHNLPTEPLQQLVVNLLFVDSLNKQSLSYIRDNFCVSQNVTHMDTKLISFNSKY